MERPPLGHVQDLATLAKLDEKILLDEIKERYLQNNIYTYVGDILISVNPFKDLGIYTKEYSAGYQNIRQSAHPPHIFAVADSAYQALTGRGGRPPGNQCILISGESGAGKTESTKLIIKQVIELSRGQSQLEQQILQVNPLLEAFGNAQTNLNDNSSRFGKYIQLKFTKGRVIGAKISEYLLEKSRVVRQNPGESSFHIFYYIFAGHTDKFGLGNPDTYRYLSNGAGDFNKRSNGLRGQYEELLNAMDLVGFFDEEQMDMFAVVASVLHLGNVSFRQNDDDSLSVTDSNGPVKTASTLLGIDSAEVEGCLTCMVTVTRGEHVTRNYSKEQAEDARDAMSKAVYGRLFGWIVNKINCLLVPEGLPPDAKLNEIGILDIFGFEDFVKDGGKNSFEQACINLANEQLQFFFNQHIFKMEQEEYLKEGIDWQAIEFVDNKPLLDLFLAKPIGVLSLLDEESMFPKGSDRSYVDKLTKAFAGSQYFVKAQQTNAPVFSINHYAGKVTYNAESWLEKNRDTLPPGIIELLQSSENPLIKTIFRGQITRTGSLALQGRRTSKGVKKRSIGPISTGQDAARRKLTVGGQFKNSLSILMERMTSSTPIFVRCLKPNHKKQPGVLDTQYVLAQLLYTGMLETIEIRRKGFAVRPTFDEFIEQYKVLVNLRLTPTSDNCKQILKFAALQGWCVGTSKVFLKYHHVEQLSELLAKVGKSATVIQKHAKGFLARKRYKRRRDQARREREAAEAMLRQAAQIALENRRRLEALAQIDTSRPKGRASLSPSAPPVPYFPADGISMISGTSSYLDPSPLRYNTTTTTGTQMEDAGTGSDPDEVLEDDFQPVPSNLKKFGRVGTKVATVNWFKETQNLNVIDQNQNRFAEWFHGIISRKESEKLLKDKIVGCFLIRVSESRFGYTLSFKAESRCRHYMIDQLKNGKFIIIGERKVHRTLHDMVAHHKKNKLSNWDHLFTVPCGQDQDGECDYQDLINEDMYFLLDAEYQATPPELPSRNYSSYLSSQSQRGNTTSAAQPPLNLKKSKNEGRPLPKVPEEAYMQLISEQSLDEHKYKSALDSAANKQKSRVSHTRQRPF